MNGWPTGPRWFREGSGGTDDRTLWGLAHAIPTRKVLAGFGPVGPDNHRVILQDWLAEAFTMWGLATIVVAVTLTGERGSTILRATYLAVAWLLLAIALLTALNYALKWASSRS